MIYRVQKGKLGGHYKDVIDETDNRGYAWKVYFETTLEYGEKKRILGDDVRIRMDRRYYTQGYGEK